MAASSRARPSGPTPPRGGTEQRVYPWGSTAPGNDTKLAVWGCWFGSDGGCYGSGQIPTVGVVPAGDGKFGQSDLAGGMLEWGLDGFGNPYAETTCTNCTHALNPSGTMTRGGAWNLAANLLLSGSRAAHRPEYRRVHVGVRCARIP